MKERPITMERKAREKSILMERWPGLVICFAVVFTALVFGPLETYCLNQGEFWFALDDIVWPVVRIAGIVFLGIAVMQFILPSVVWYGTAGLAFATTLGLYMQVNIINPDYGVLGALEMDWSQYATHACIDAAIWIALVIAMLVLACKLRRKFIKVASAIAALLIVMQGASMSVLLIEYYSSETENTKNVITNDGAFDLGNAEGSAIVFIVDTMDDTYFDFLLENEPEIADIFGGFTRFTNCTGSYSKTGGAVPYIISGQYNLNTEPNYDFNNRVYGESKLLKALRDNAYDIRIFSDNNSDVLLNYVDNAAPAEQEVFDAQPLANALLKLSMFRQAPELLKEKLYVETSTFNFLMNQTSVTNQWTANDADFYVNLCREGVTAQKDSKTFRIIHLFGAHAPYSLTAEATWNEKGTTSLEQNLGVIKILREYLEGMKKASVFHQSTIMIIADHSRYLNGDVLTLVKPPYAEGELQVSQAPVSHEDVHNTLLACMGLEPVEYGRNMFEVDENEIRDRVFYMYDILLQGNYTGYLPPLWEIRIGKNENDPFYTGNVYTDHGLMTYADYAPVARLGQIYDCDAMQDFFSFGFFSWGSTEDGNIWGNNERGQMFFKLDQVPENGVDLIMKLDPWIPIQNIELTITTIDDCKLLFSTVFEKSADPEVTVHIPADAFTDEGLTVLEFHTPVTYFHRDTHRAMNLCYYSFTVQDAASTVN